jgi:hypothetical protein
MSVAIMLIIMFRWSFFRSHHPCQQDLLIGSSYDVGENECSSTAAGDEEQE